MSCCDKKVIKKLVHKAANIVKGNVRVLTGKKYEFTDDRIRACHECDEQYWLGRSLWCKICKCYIPAKARVEEEKCPLNKWDRKE